MKVTLFLLPKLIILSVLIQTSLLLAQGSAPQKRVDPADDLIQELRKNLARDRTMLEQYFNSGFLDKVDDFFKDSRFKLDQDPEYQRMLEEFEKSFQGMGSGIRTEWREDKRGRIYILHASLDEKGKFDLKVKENKVIVSGLLKRDIGRYGSRAMSFKKSFPVPSDVDANKVQVKPGEGNDKARPEVWLIFPWKPGKGLKTYPVKKSLKDKII